MESASEDRIQFFAKSADKRAGEGVGDQIKHPRMYESLCLIPNWRKIFCSLWDIQSFQHEGYTYKSVDHAYQAAKFCFCNCESTAFLFALESCSQIAGGSGLDAFHARKICILDHKQIKRWDTVSREFKRQIYRSKYSQIPIAKQVLLGTCKAELWNKGPRIKEQRCYLLEETREWLRSQT